MGFHIFRGAFSSLDEKPKVTWALLRRVMGYGRPYRWHIAGMMAVIFIQSGLNLLSPLILRDLIDTTIPERDFGRLGLLALALLLLPVIDGVGDIFERRLNAAAGEGVIYDLRVALYSNLQRMSLRFFTNTRVGELMSRLNNDVVGAQSAVTNTLVNIFTNVVQLASTLVVMLVLEWRLTLVSAAILPLFLLAARKLGFRLRDIARQQMDTNAQMNATLNETLNISGALLVKLFGRRQAEVDRFRQRAGAVRSLGIRRAVMMTTFYVIVALVSATGTALVYGIGGYLVMEKLFSVGTIVAFGAYLGTLYRTLSGLTNAPVEFATSVVSFERVFEVIDLPQEIADAADAVALASVRGELEFDHVSFRYEINEDGLLSEVRRYGQMDNIKAVLSGGPTPSPTQGAPKKFETLAPDASAGVRNSNFEMEGSHGQARESALEDISFHVRPGELVALVGPSGAGKTTLTYLIPRLYDPSEGQVLVDGHDLRRVTLESLTAQIGMVTQETHLFHDTIRTNLAYARPDATQAELEAACQAANIHDFITGLPQQYDTVVGERGYRLSGGEKQRVALARVILKDPRILVLDEATSHLDSESERLIQDALKRVMAGRTSIVIAHRLSTILAADQILVFDRGRVVESGTHAALLARGGLYAHLYETQYSRRTEVV